MGAGAGGRPTDQVARGAVGRGVQDAHHAARIADGLPEPDGVFVGAVAGVDGPGGVLGVPRLFVARRHGEDEEQGERGPRDVCEEVGVREGIYVDKGQAAREAQLVDQGGHKLGVTSAASQYAV